MQAGIYEIRNTVSGKRYVGSTAHLSVRFLQHRSKLRKGTHDNPHLQSAWQKYGEIAFKYNILAILEPREIIETEQRLLDQMKRLGEESYNIAAFACSGAKGRSPSAETRKKQAASVKATYDKPGKREAHSKIIRQRYEDPEFTKRNGDSVKKAWADLPPEVQQAHIAARRAPLDTPEARERLRASVQAMYKDPEYKARHAEACRVANQDPERRKKLSIAGTGRKHSEESKRKMAEARRLAWQDPIRKAKSMATKAATLAKRAEAKQCS